MVAAQDSPAIKVETELRRGVLVLAVLSQLRTEQYGYSLRQALAEQGMPIEEGTLYPLLRRLEDQELSRATGESRTGRRAATTS